jgi:hypothetical protein
VKRARLMLRALSVVIIALILVQTVAGGQSTSGLVIQVLQANKGENLTDKELPPLKVRIMDRTGRVISGASVAFIAPEDGPSGHFLPDTRRITVTTDPEGVATAPPFLTNSRVGDYQIQVVASYRAAESRAVILQTNIFKAKSTSNRKFIVLSAVIGGAAAAALVSRHGNSGPASSALEALAVTPTISLGGSSTVAVSAPILGPVSSAPSGDTGSSTTIVSVPALPSASDTVSPPPASSGSTVTVQPTVPTQPTVQPVPTQPSAPSQCETKPKTANKRGCR